MEELCVSVFRVGVQLTAMKIFGYESLLSTASTNASDHRPV